MNDNARLAAPHGQNVQGQLAIGGQPNEVHAQVAALAEQFRLFKLEITAAEERGQANAIAKMQGQFALAAAANQAQEKGAERVTKTIEELGAEMKKNYAALADENRSLKAEMAKAEAREIAAAAAHRAAQNANRKEVSELKVEFRTLKGEFVKHKHVKAHDVAVVTGYHNDVLMQGMFGVPPKPIYRYDPSYTEGPTY